jgi:hypothetical protein
MLAGLTQYTLAQYTRPPPFSGSNSPVQSGSLSPVGEKRTPFTTQYQILSSTDLAQLKKDDEEAYYEIMDSRFRLWLD